MDWRKNSLKRWFEGISRVFLEEHQLGNLAKKRDSNSDGNRLSWRTALSITKGFSMIKMVFLPLKVGFLAKELW